MWSHYTQLVLCGGKVEVLMASVRVVAYSLLGPSHVFQDLDCDLVPRIFSVVCVK